MSTGAISPLDIEHPTYAARKARWQFILDYYTGDVILPEKRAQYLRRKAQGESEAAYQDRLANSRYRNHFGKASDSLVGMLWAVDADGDRRWMDETTGLGLGSLEDKNSVASRLMRDADGAGTGWTTMLKQAHLLQVPLGTIWYAVDTIGEGAKRRAIARYLNPLCVADWGADFVKVKESRIVRASWREAPIVTEAFTVYELTGWKRWIRGKQGEEVLLTSGSYEYYDRLGNPVLPIFQSELALRRDVGYQAAQAAHGIHSATSARDHALWSANFSRLVLTTQTATEYDKQVDRIVEGSNILYEAPESKGGHRYIGPETGPAETTGKALEREIDEFYITFFRSYGDAAVQKTATEVRQDVAADTGAILQLLAATADDAENRLLDLVAQAEFGARTPNAFKASVKRSDDFAPADVNAVIELLTKRAFGETTGYVPMGTTARVAAARQVAEWQGLDFQDDEIEREVRVEAVKRQLDLVTQVWDTVPAKAKAQLTAQVLEAVGIEDAQAMLADIEELANVSDEAKLQLADYAATARAGAGVPPNGADDDTPPGAPDPADEGARAAA